jgi:hypothetical protein
MTFREKLITMQAFQSLLDWVGSRTEAEALRDCDRGDWLLWWFWREVGNEGYPNIKTVFKAKDQSADLIKGLMKNTKSIAELGEYDTILNDLLKRADPSLLLDAASYAANAAGLYRVAILRDCAEICRKYFFVPKKIK